MNHPEPTHAAAGQGTPAADQPASVGAEHASGPDPARGQRLLAGTLSATSLATGVNAVMQAAKTLARFWPPGR